MGGLPDFTDEFSLYRLSHMCENIKSVYPIGGQVITATDGLVFEDVVGIPDEDTWDYGESLIEMMPKHGLDNLKSVPPMEILGRLACEARMDKSL
jgi:pyoverdine/dityrosine biosynthesis protein Dit1